MTLGKLHNLLGYRYLLYNEKTGHLQSSNSVIYKSNFFEALIALDLLKMLSQFLFYFSVIFSDFFFLLSLMGVPKFNTWPCFSLIFYFSVISRDSIMQVLKILTMESDCLGLNTSVLLDQVCDLREVIQPLCASVSSSRIIQLAVRIVVRVNTCAVPRILPDRCPPKY